MNFHILGSWDSTLLHEEQNDWNDFCSCVACNIIVPFDLYWLVALFIYSLHIFWTYTFSNMQIMLTILFNGNQQDEGYHLTHFADTFYSTSANTGPYCRPTVLHSIRQSVACCDRQSYRTWANNFSPGSTWEQEVECSYIIFIRFISKFVILELKARSQLMIYTA